MIFENLLTNYDTKTFELYAEIQDEEIKRYVDFVLSLIDDEKTKEKIRKNYEDTIAYVIDRTSTEVPRNFYGKSKPGRIPRAANFVREQLKVEQDGVVFDVIKNGIGLRIQEKNQGAIFHEMNHAMSRDSIALQQDGAVYKHGMHISKLNLQEDKYEALTGELFDESMTDAISYFYYTKNNDMYKDEQQNQIEYTTAYDSIRLFSTILLGENLENKSLLNAYFGDVEALKKFGKEFDKIVLGSEISFEDVLKTRYTYNANVVGEYISDEQLVELACKYRFGKSENMEQLMHEKEFVESLGVKEEVFKPIFENKAQKIEGKLL